jgi:hypothetical protein
VFPVSRLGADDMGLLRGLRLLGSGEGVQEEIHAIVSAVGATTAGAAGDGSRPGLRGRRGR